MTKRSDTTSTPVASDEQLTRTGSQLPAVPDYMKGDIEAAHDSYDRLDSSQLKMPMLTLCQSMTPERKRSNSNFIEGLNEGDFFNDLLQTNYGTSIRVIKLKFWSKGNIIKFRPQDSGGGIICRAEGGQCACSRELAAGRLPKGTQWGEDGKAPECTQFFNYLFFLPDFNEVVWYSAKRTALNACKEFNGRFQNPKLMARPSYAYLSTLSSAVDHDGANHEYFKPSFSAPVYWPETGLVKGDNGKLYADIRDSFNGYKGTIIDTSRAEERTDDGEGPNDRGHRRGDPVDSTRKSDDKIPF